jgi:hypothetical protein
VSTAVKLTNPVCLDYIRSFQGVILNTEVVEKAMCLKLGLAPREYKRVGSRVQNADPNAASMMVWISDNRLVSHIEKMRKRNGVCGRHTVETAILYAIERSRAQGAAR